MPDKIKDLYDMVSSTGAFKDEAEFRTFASDTNNFKDIYDMVSTTGAFKDKLEFDEFTSDLKKKGSSASPSISEDGTKTSVSQEEADKLINELPSQVKDKLTDLTKYTPEHIQSSLSSIGVPQDQIDKALQYKAAIDKNKIVATATLPTLKVTAKKEGFIALTKPEDKVKGDVDQTNLKLAQSYAANGKLDQAITLSQSVADDNPDVKEYQDYANRLGGYSSSKKGDNVNAAKYYDAITEKTPDDHYNAAYNKYATGDIGGAMKNIKEIEALPTSTETINTKINSKKLWAEIARDSGDTETSNKISKDIDGLEYRKEEIDKGSIFEAFTTKPFTPETFEKAYSEVKNNILLSPILGAAESVGETITGVQKVSEGDVVGGVGKMTKGMIGTLFNMQPSMYVFNVALGGINKIEKTYNEIKADQLLSTIPQEIKEKVGAEGIQNIKNKLSTSVTDKASEILFAPVTTALDAMGVLDKIPEAGRDWIGVLDVSLTIATMMGGKELVKFIKDNPKATPEEVQVKVNEISADIKDKTSVIEEIKNGEEIKPESVQKLADAVSGKSIEPKPEVTTDTPTAIKEVLSIPDADTEAAKLGKKKYGDLDESDANVIYGMKDKPLDAIPYEKTDTPEIIKSGEQQEFLEKQGYIEYNQNIGDNGVYELTDKGKEFNKTVDARIETRKGVKEGTDLFPETANIPELKKGEPEINPLTGEPKPDLPDNVKLTPTIKVGENTYYGKDHGEAMQKAIDAGEKIPSPDGPEGKLWRSENGKFTDQDNNVLTRDEAQDKYGVSASEEIQSKNLAEAPQVKEKIEEPILTGNKLIDKQIKEKSTQGNATSFKDIKPKDISLSSQVFKNPVDDSGQFDMSQKEKDEFIKKNKENTTEQKVNVSDIIPTQDLLDNRHIQKRETEDNPVLVRTKDGIYILDGHHRIAADINSGKVVTNADVIDLSAETPEESIKKEEVTEDISKGSTLDKEKLKKSIEGETEETPTVPPVKPSGETTGITREILKKEQIEQNLSEPEKLFISSSDPVAWNNVVKKIEENPDLYSQRVEETFSDATLGNKPKVTDEDPLIALHEKVKLKIQHENASNKIAEARSKGDIGGEIAATLEREGIENKQQENIAFVELIGSSLGKGLRNIGFLSDKSFDFAGLTHEIERDQGFKVTSEQSAKYRKLSEDYEKLRKEYGDVEKQKAAFEESRKTTVDDALIEKIRAEIKAESGKKPKTTAGKAKVLADNIRKLKTKPFTFTDENGNVIDVTKMGASWNDIVEMVAKAVEKGGEYIDRIRDILKDFEIYGKLSDKDKVRFENKIIEEATNFDKKTTIDELKSDAIEKSGGELHAGMKSNVDKLLRKIVEENPDINYHQATYMVFDALKEGIPDLKYNDVRDMISGYGKYKLLSKEQVDVTIREIKTQNRLDAALEATEREELPLRSGTERHAKTQETRAKEAKILQNIKDKGIEPKLTAEELSNQYKSAEEAYQKKIENAIADIEKEIETGIKREKAQPKEYTSERTQQLRSDLETLKKIRDEKLGSPKVEAKIKATEKAIADIEAEITKLKRGELPEGEPTVKRVKGKDTFSFKKKQTEKITNDRIKELESIKQNLQDEKSNLIPEEIKNRAIINKEKTIRQRRLEQLQDLTERGKTDKSVYLPKEPPPPKPFDKKLDDINVKIKKIENIVDSEKEKIRLANRGRVEKAISLLSKFQRFMIFLNPWGMGRLTLAAMYRPLLHIPTESAKYILSHLPISKRIMEKSAGMYRPTVGSSVRSVERYYTKLVAKSTFESAISEYHKRSNYSLLYDKGAIGDRYSNTVERILVAPEQTHGFLKAFPKEAKHYATYEAALENLANMVDKRTGEVYDITDPSVQQLAMEEAKMEGYSDVFMQDAILAKATNSFANSLISSDQLATQIVGGYVKQLQPVLKVPENFFGEILQQVPLIGTLEAAQKVFRSGERGKQTGGIKNLTPEQAHKAARAMVNQVVGMYGLGIAAGLYAIYQDDIIKSMEKYKYWIHNTAEPIIMTGLRAVKESKESGENYSLSLIKEMGKTIGEQTKKLPQTRAAEQVAKVSFHIGKLVVGKETWEQASKPAQEMLSVLLIPAGSAELAKRMDDEQKRDPETFKEILNMRIPGFEFLKQYGIGRTSVPTDVEKKSQKEGIKTEEAKTLIDEAAKKTAAKALVKKELEKKFPDATKDEIDILLNNWESKYNKNKTTKEKSAEKKKEKASEKKRKAVLNKYKMFDFTEPTIQNQGGE